MKTIQIVGDSTYGGATYLLLRWCQFLLDKQCEVTVLTSDDTTIAKLKEIPGIQIINSIFVPREILPFQDLRAFRQLLTLLRSQKYDVVHTYTATPSFLGRIAACVVGVPVILHHQAGWTVTEFSSLRDRILYTPLEYAATLSSTKSICVSHAVAHQARRFHIAPQRKLVTICNGIDPKPFVLSKQNDRRANVRRDLEIASECLLIGNAGRLAAQKDIATLIRSVSFLKDLLLDMPFLLLLAGDGPDRTALEKLAYSSGVSSHVRFMGFYTDIPGLLAALDIFISTSLWEGLSISLIEAMAAAKPIIATNILPNAELIEQEVTGLLVPPQEPEQVAHAIARFAHKPDFALRCGAAAQQRVLESYTIERMFNETWELYVQLLEEERGQKKL